MTSGTSRQLAALLQREQRRFLAFLAPKLGSQEAARDVLQAALVKAMERGETLRDDESATAWFYRLLRNSVIDHYRRGDVERRALEGHATEVTLAEEEIVALEREVCSCVSELKGVVKPEYAEIVQAVDLDDTPIAEFAADRGIAPGNARVRLHRARVAMSERLLEMCGTCCASGCQNCPCEAP